MKFVVFVSMVLGSIAYADYQYVFPTYPSNGQNCHSVALQVGATFAKATGAQVTSSNCLSQTATTCRIDISYAAASPVNIVSTAVVDPMVASHGRYQTEQTCLDALAQETKTFAQETKLSPAFSYCTSEVIDPDAPASDDYPWYPNIVAFGTAVRQPFISGYYIFGLPYGLDATQYRTQLFAGVTGRGITPVTMVSRSTIAYGMISLFYYHDTKVSLNLDSVTNTDTSDQCQAQATELSGFYKATTNDPVFVYCATAPTNGKAELALLFVGPPGLKTPSSIERFTTFDLCEASRPALEETYRTQYQISLPGALCSKGEKDYGLTLFEN